MKLRYSLLILSALVLISYACGNKTQEHSDHSNDTTTNADNQVLYNQVMDIHDEVMPKTEEIYNIRKRLKAAIKDVSSSEEEELIQRKIDYLDSVNRMMMDWMHEFRPLPDSTNEETARAYYETHLEKVKLVKEAILQALEQEK